MAEQLGHWVEVTRFAILARFDLYNGIKTRVLIPLIYKPLDRLDPFAKCRRAGSFASPAGEAPPPPCPNCTPHLQQAVGQWGGAMGWEMAGRHP